MYDEKKFSVNWFKIGLRLAIILLICLLAIKLFAFIKESRSNSVETNAMQEKINLIERIGKEYLKDKLPEKPGESTNVTLKDLVEKKLLDEVKDTNDKSCSLEDSYVRVIRLDNEYQYKTKLVCPTFEDFKNTFVTIKDASGNEVNIEKTTTTSKVIKTTKKVSTTKPTTTTKKYRVSFNTNGGNLIADQFVIENKKLGDYVAPQREGYKFIGWYYHGKPFDLNTLVTKDYVLVAKWIKE